VPEPRAAVRNAADPKQVKRADRYEKRRAERRLANLQAVLATPAGRALIWDWLADAGIYRSVWDNSARIHYNAGRQDFGHERLAEVVAADEQLYMVMESEARARARRDNAEIEAGHTPAATEQGEQNNG
jgi:hypothetical protein